MMHLNDEEQRQMLEDAVDRAINKWLDKQFAAFGKWSIMGIGALLLAALTWLYFHTGGFKS